MTNPQIGDFQLVHTAGPVGTTIRILQWLNGDGFSDYEHARVYIGSPDDTGTTGLFVEAEPKGARLARHQIDYKNSAYKWSTGLISLSFAQRAMIAYAALRYEGVGYSFLDYASLAAKRLHVWVPGLRKYIAATGHMICSQLVARCYFDAGVPLFKGWTGDVTPGDLARLLDSREHKQA